MNIFENYKHVLVDNYTNFSGRASRSEFWYYNLINIGITFVLMVPFYAMIFSNSADSSLFYVLFGIYIIYALATVLPNLAVSVRRLHDAGYSGWFYLLALIPYIGGIILLVFMVLPSQQGWNKWGPNPYESEDQINEIGNF